MIHRHDVGFETNIMVEPIPQELLEEYERFGLSAETLLRKFLPQQRMFGAIRHGPHYRFLACLQDNHPGWGIRYYGGEWYPIYFSIPVRDRDEDLSGALKECLNELRVEWWKSSSSGGKNGIEASYGLCLPDKTDAWEFQVKLAKAYEILVRDRTSKIDFSLYDEARFSSF